jgi:thiamine pyrophosphokinase
MPAKGVGVKAIVVAGGDAAPEDAAQLASADVVIAADSGAAWLDAVGRQPDLLIGDMDSIAPNLLERLKVAGVPVESHPAEKDASDAELALARAVTMGAGEIVILGGFGGRRLDHELANLLLLTEPWNGAELRLVRGGTTARAIHAERPLDLEGRVGDVVTLLPLAGDAIGVRTRGLRYPLDGETMHLGRSRGLSNVIEEAPASVSLEEGMLLVIETRKEQARDHHSR